FALRYNSSMTVRVELRGDFERNIEDGAGLLLAGKPAWLARYFDGLFPFQIAAGIEGRRGNIILRAAFDAHKLIFAFLEIHKIFAIKYADPCARSPQVLLAPLSMREIENHLPFRGLVAAGKLVGLGNLKFLVHGRQRFPLFFQFIPEFGGRCLGVGDTGEEKNGKRNDETLYVKSAIAAQSFDE